MKLKNPIKRRIVQLVACVSVLLGSAVVAAPQAMALGILPPANPGSDCDQSSNASGNWNLASLNICRWHEGVGPAVLPSNWASLTPTEQGFVLINLERVNRGVDPIVGLSASLNAFATRGALAQDDPPFPSSGAGGGIWAGSSSIFAADTMWMYDDGPGGFDANDDCISGDGCWGHRDIILGNDGGGTLVAGGGFYGGGGGSYAYLIMSHYSTADLTFSWASELKYFDTNPSIEPVGEAVMAGVKAVAAKDAKKNAHRRPHKKLGLTPGKKAHKRPHKKVRLTPGKKGHKPPHEHAKRHNHGKNKSADEITITFS